MGVGEDHQDALTEETNSPVPPILPAPKGIPDWVVMVGLVGGFVVFYRGSYQLPLTALGMGIFSLCALLRPPLALLFVPLTAHLFLMPKGLWDERYGLRPSGYRLKVHELFLVVVIAAIMARVGLRIAVEVVTRRSFKHAPLVIHLRTLLQGRQVCAMAWFVAPLALFLLIGSIATFIMPPPEGRAPAIREWRWLIIEPLILYILLRLALAHSKRFQWQLILTLVVGGAVVALVGILQYVGINLVPLIGDKVGFGADATVAEGVRRVTSFYGHPNNLGLTMERLLPLGYALGFASLPYLRAEWGMQDVRAVRVVQVVLLGSTLLMGIAVLLSFSKGALIATFVALLIITAAQVEGRGRIFIRPAWLISVVLVGSAVGIGAILFFSTERFDLLGASSGVRVKTWLSALAMVRDYPLFGVGMDQFLRHYPDYIHPSLANTNEQFTSHPHNLLLDVWLRMGVVGVVIFGWLFGRFFRPLLRECVCLFRRQQPHWSPLDVGLLAAMSATVVHGLVDNFYFVPNLAIIFWVYMALREEGEVVGHCGQRRE